LFETAEFQKGLAAGFWWGETLMKIVVDVELEVEI
jgi:hypothetical protein